MTEWLSSIAPALANHLWQSTAFAAAIWLATLLLRRNQARIRYALWLAASLKFLIPFSLLIAIGTHLARPTHPTPSQTTTYLAIDEMSQPFTSESALIPAAPASSATSTSSPPPSPARPPSAASSTTSSPSSAANPAP